jgi:hypothetical protein
MSSIIAVLTDKIALLEAELDAELAMPYAELRVGCPHAAKREMRTHVDLAQSIPALLRACFYYAGATQLAMTGRRCVTNEKTTVGNDGTTGGTRPSSEDKTAKSSISRERRFLDAIEDDDVREVLRGFHQLPRHPISPAKKI